MSLRTRVTRSPPVPAVARARPTAEHLIYCDSDTGGTGNTDIMSIPLTVPTSYERVYLAATVWGFQAGGWTLTFQATDIPFQWSEEYTLDAEATLVAITLDGELDDRERALVTVWSNADYGVDPDYDRHQAGAMWGFGYWASIYRPGVGTTPALPGDPYYDPLYDRTLIEDLHGSVHRDHTNFGPDYPYSVAFPYGDHSSTALETYEMFPTYQHFDEDGQPVPFLPVTLPAGTALGAWFEPDLVGAGDPVVYWMEYDPGTATGTPMPAVPFSATVTFHFEGSHENVLIEDDF